MATQLLWLTVGLALLVKGGELFVSAAARRGITEGVVDDFFVSFCAVLWLIMKSLEKPSVRGFPLSE